MKPLKSADRQSMADEAFLSRWSRLKQRAESPLELDEDDAPLTVETEPQPSLTDQDMPPIESLTEESDYSGFLSPEVTEGLRQQALQKLFRSACFNLCDGLDDYAEDFTSFEKLGDVMTADLKFRMQEEAKRLAKESEGGGLDAESTDQERTVSVDEHERLSQDNDSALEGDDKEIPT